ncbi:tetratricopeptide repeat protein [Salidesulfovibrio onnuriiensis]|uniref:tetratricopeptide repeat protein n=1 Tax=Salidesulfovibrio onnuriiensis TaxID=2583823 RepID=UPI0011C7AD20|nr:tetratricopeptide repeat protein [Salidesulfovibrio onnuriiensis]
MHKASFFPLLLLMAALCACTVSSAGVGVGRGSGVAMISVYNDFLYSGPSKAYQNNREGLRQFKAGKYTDAANTFQRTLDSYPGNPDASYFLGLSLIGMGDREQGFDTLVRFRDPWRYRVAGEITWWAGYLRKRPHLTDQEIFNTMKRIRGEAYNQYLMESRDSLLWFR